MILKKFNLRTPIDIYEYIRLSLKLIPEEIIAQYGLKGVEHNGYIYSETRKGMHRLSQAKRISNYYLKKNLETHGCHQ